MYRINNKQHLEISPEFALEVVDNAIWLILMVFPIYY